MQAVFSTEETDMIERLIRISKEKPLLPEQFVPWSTALLPDHTFLPEKLISLEGLPVYQTLNDERKRLLGKYEVAQSMFAYMWSEGLFCMFMNRHIQHRPPEDIERRFLLRELIEECRHQDMFAETIKKLGVKPVPPSRIQRFLADCCVRFFSVEALFLSCIAVEMMADRYGDHIRKDQSAYPVLQRVAQLHNIEEARHILYTKAYLRSFVKRPGWLRSSWYSIIVLANMRFFQGMYIHKSIYAAVGLTPDRRFMRRAFANYQQKFADECLDSLKEFVNDFGGFNAFTRPLWRWVLKVKV